MKIRTQQVFAITAFIVGFLISPFVLYAQFYVAPNGNDNNSGLSAEHAFATLDAAREAMRKSKVKTTYVRAGTYFPTTHFLYAGISCGLILEAADSGETWSYYPPDGYNTAILDGRSTSPDTGLYALVLITCDGVTWNGIQIQNFIWNGIYINHASHTTIINNIIHNGTFNMNGSGKNISGAGAILAAQSPNLMISNNAIYDIAYCGILVGVTVAGNSNNTTIQNNVVLNTMIGIQDGAPIKDGGAIYLMDRLHSSVNIIVRNNFIRNYGASTSTSWSKGLYFDDGASNIIATGNIITGTGEYAIQYHGGYNIVVKGNIIDIGSADNQKIAIYQNAGKYGTAMGGNVFANNIILTSRDSIGNNWHMGPEILSNFPVMKNNVYYNYADILVNNEKYNRLKEDKSLIYENPMICGALYSISPESPVFKSPINFPPIVGGWGPPGYVIPMERAKTSCPPCK